MPRHITNYNNGTAPRKTLAVNSLNEMISLFGWTVCRTILMRRTADRFCCLIIIKWRVEHPTPVSVLENSTLGMIRDPWCIICLRCAVHSDGLKSPLALLFFPANMAVSKKNKTQNKKQSRDSRSSIAVYSVMFQKHLITLKYITKQFTAHWIEEVGTCLNAC